MTPKTTGPDGRDVDLGVEQLPHFSQEDHLHTQLSTHPVTPARNPGPVRYDDWQAWPATPQKEIDELVEWVKGPR